MGCSVCALAYACVSLLTVYQRYCFWLSSSICARVDWIGSSFRMVLHLPFGVSNVPFKVNTIPIHSTFATRIPSNFCNELVYHSSIFSFWKLNAFQVFFLEGPDFSQSMQCASLSRHNTAILYTDVIISIVVVNAALRCCCCCSLFELWNYPFILYYIINVCTYVYMRIARRTWLLRRTNVEYASSVCLMLIHLKCSSLVWPLTAFVFCFASVDVRSFCFLFISFVSH